MKIILWWILGSAYIFYDFKRGLGRIEMIHVFLTLTVFWSIAPIVLFTRICRRVILAIRR